jgi:anti-anti-sigma factor
MDSLVDVTQEEKGDVLILKISGRLDATSSPLLEKKVLSFIEAGKWKLLLNFEKVEYLSSAGMRLLLATTKKLKSKDGKMVVTCIADNVLEVIKMAGFDHILNITETEDEGLKVI